MVEETRVPRGNPCKHGENMQTAHRKALPQPGIEPRTFLQWGCHHHYLFVFLTKHKEPTPAKIAASDPSFASSENAAESSCSRWQEDQQGRGASGTPMWTVTDTDPPGPEQTPAGAAEAKHTHTHTHTCPAFMSISQSEPLPVLVHCPNLLQMFTHLQRLSYTFHLTQAGCREQICHHGNRAGGVVAGSSVT